MKTSTFFNSFCKATSIWDFISFYFALLLIKHIFTPALHRDAWVWDGWGLFQSCAERTLADQQLDSTGHISKGSALAQSIPNGQRQNVPPLYRPLSWLYLLTGVLNSNKSAIKSRPRQLKCYYYLNRQPNEVLRYDNRAPQPSNCMTHIFIFVAILRKVKSSRLDATSTSVH